MNDTVNLYLESLSAQEPEYMTEGIKQIATYFDKKDLKRATEELHLYLTKNDQNARKSFSMKVKRVGKAPKYKEVAQYANNVKKDHPEMGESADYAKRVIKGLFKIRDKAKLEIMANAVAASAFVKSKGKTNQMQRETQNVLKDLKMKVGNIYDLGMDQDVIDKDTYQQIIQSQRKSERVEQIIMVVLLSILVGAFVFVGVVIWSIITSKLVAFFILLIITMPLLTQVAANFGG